MAKHLRTLCTGNGPAKIKYHTELDAKITIVQAQLEMNKSGGRKNKEGTKTIPKRAYLHEREHGGCGYWHTTSEDARPDSQKRKRTSRR